MLCSQDRHFVLWQIATQTFRLIFYKLSCKLSLQFSCKLSLHRSNYDVGLTALNKKKTQYQKFVRLSSILIQTCPLVSSSMILITILICVCVCCMCEVGLIRRNEKICGLKHVLSPASFPATCAAETPPSQPRLPRKRLLPSHVCRGNLPKYSGDGLVGFWGNEDLVIYQAAEDAYALGKDTT